MKKYKLPNKKQEAEFIQNLKPAEKVYTVFERPYWHESGDWEGIVYCKKLNIFQNIIVFLYNRFIPK